MTKTRLTLEGVLTAEELDKCEERLNSMNAVSAVIDRDSKIVDIEYDETKVSISDICSEISAAAGVNVTAARGEVKDVKQASRIGIVGKTILTVLFSAAIILLRVLDFFGVGLPLVDGSPMLLAMAEIFLYAFAAYFAREVYIKGFAALFRLRPDTKSVAAVGTLASAAYSTYAFAMIISGNADYMLKIHLDACAVIISVVMLCGALEQKSRGRTGEPVKKLYSLFPKTATVILDDKEIEVGLDEITVDDSILVKPMQSFPCDGIIEAGRTSVNEVLFTGENMPVIKSAGDRVFAGTLNTSGFVTIKAERIGRDTSLSRMIRSVRNLSASKPKVAGLVEKSERIYSAIVLLAGVFGFIVSMLLSRGFEASAAVFIGTLVMFCPCALGLVVPAASVYASGKATQAGIVFKDVVSLETLRFVDTVVLDKTGTITVGKLFVTDVVPFGTSEEEVISLAVSLEGDFAHPVAVGIQDYAVKNDVSSLKCEARSVITGYGVKGKINGDSVLITDIKSAFKGEYEGYGAICEPLVSDGKIVMAVMKNDIPIGAVALKDKIKPTSKAAVEKLNKMGRKTIMLTGDSRKAAAKVAKELDFCEYAANVLPGKKADVINELRRNGEKVAMVGDSLNDSVALAAADIGVAIGTGSSVAIELAQVVLVRNDLRDLSNAIRLSATASKIIKENIFWTFVFAAGVLPLSVAVVYALGQPLVYPLFVGACIALSFAAVMVNSSRLKRLDLTLEDDIAQITPKKADLKRKHRENK